MIIVIVVVAVVVAGDYGGGGTNIKLQIITAINKHRSRPAGINVVMVTKYNACLTNMP